MEKITLVQALIALAAGKTVMKDFLKVSALDGEELKVWHRINSEGILEKSFYPFTNEEKARWIRPAVDLYFSETDEFYLVSDFNEQHPEDLQVIAMVEETLADAGVMKAYRAPAGQDLDEHLFPIGDSVRNFLGMTTV